MSSGGSGFDEPTDITDTAELAVMVRMVFYNFAVKEDLLKLLPMKAHTTDMPLHKLSAITTDEAPAIVGNINGFIALCKKDKSFPNFLSYHCIIHQEVLCGRILPFEHVIKIVTKIVNFIRAVPLQHRLFKALLANSEEPDLILYSKVRWLGKGKTLSRFVNLLEEIKNYLNSKDKTFAELTDSCWLVDLGFITDVMEKLNNLNLELQGKDLHIASMIGSVNSFKAKLGLWISHLQMKSLVHFPNMKKMIGDIEIDLSSFVVNLQSLQNQFEKRFQQFTTIEPMVIFFVNPFTCQVNVTKMAAQIAELVQALQMTVFCCCFRTVLRVSVQERPCSIPEKTSPPVHGKDKATGNARNHHGIRRPSEAPYLSLGATPRSPLPRLAPLTS
ncbi:hypothetical protein J437_LFUL001263 [Ladona fulva]|uniref:Uncharacterized protein n=1 Tax=Ladona fulva TaxID=123851 RepID=A0A8K0NUJ4_LADFU|nr:hypothetical protein J437_LFUL001263 [Ladona fulva]